MRDGGPDDPRLALILFTAERATYMKQDKPTPVVRCALVKGMVTGKRADIGKVRELSGSDLGA